MGGAGYLASNCPTNMRVLVVAVLLLASCVGPALSFSTGAPQQACNTATLNHPATPQNTSTPYRIDLSVLRMGVGTLRTCQGGLTNVSLGSINGD